MTISMHGSLTWIGRQLHADYLPILAEPLPSELKRLVVRLEQSIPVLQSAVAKPGPQPQSTRVSIGSWCRLKKWIFDPYRPELHYMRGPGPKWREKHAHGGSSRPMSQQQQDCTSAEQDLQRTPAAIATSRADLCRSPNPKEEVGLQHP